MKRAVILFSGQGSQVDGMGIDFYQADPRFKEMIDQASELTKLSLLEVFKNCQTATTLELQPALTAFEVALFQMLTQDFELEIVGAVGLSLGEYPALIASGALFVPEGLALVTKRAKFMQAEAKTQPGALVAVLKPDLTELNKLCQQCSNEQEIVQIANYNSPKQVVLGGHVAAVERLTTKLAVQGKKVVKLNVAGAFHTPLFATSKAQLAKEVTQIKFKDPAFTIFSNTTVEPFTAENLASILPKQVIEPTHFAKCLTQTLETKQPDLLLEIGPGNTLSKFARQIERSIPCYQVDTLERYRKTLAELREQE